MHAMVERDHRVGDVFLETLAREHLLAALGRDDRGDAAVAHPAEQAPQLGAQDAGVLETAKQGLDGVEHDALGADLPDRVVEPHEQSFEIVFAGFLDLAAIHVDVVDDQLLLRDQRVEVITERPHVLRELIGVLLERHEHAGLGELLGAVHEKADSEQCLAGARAA